MRKVVLSDFGGPEVATVTDQPEPVCPQGGYLVEVRAAGLNFADVVERRGRYRKNQTLPYELGKEAAGVVLERGPDASRFGVGDEVIVIRFAGGCYAERVAATEDQVLRGPKGHSFEQLAAFGITFATAWYALAELARVRPGESVLIQAAAGGVGTAAVKLARAMGCGPVLGTAGSEAKCKLVRELGADACANYRDEDFEALVQEATAGRGVDFALESVGGEVFQKTLTSLAPRGRLVTIGFSSISDNYAEALGRIHPLTLFHRSVQVAGLNVENLDFPTDREVWSALVAFAEEHRLEPVIGPTFPLEQVADAHRALENRKSVGKVLLVR